MTRSLILLALLTPLLSATSYTVKVGGGGNFTTMSACATQMSTNGPSVADTCTVFAGTYAENVTIPAGSVGNYKTFTVNASDIVTVQSFTLSSHTQVIGNCSSPAAINTCGFNIQNPSSPSGRACVSIPSGITDFAILNNVMYACGGGAMIGIAGGDLQSASYGHIQGNTLSYACVTQAQAGTAVKECNGMQLSGDHFLVENNDMSHYTLGMVFEQANYSIWRNNTIHDEYETEAGGNAHTDMYYSSTTTTTDHNVIEHNVSYNGIGPNAKGFLTQGQFAPCNGACAHGVIYRYNVLHDLDGSNLSGYGYNNVKMYNNTYVNIFGGSGGDDNFLTSGFGMTNGADLNSIWYYPNAVTSVLYPIAVDSGSTAGGNWGNSLAYCNASGSSNCTLFRLAGGGSFTAYPGNRIGFIGQTGGPAGNPTNNPNFSNLAAKDYHLGANSAALGTGTFLTTVAAGDSGTGTSLAVNDAWYFQDGYGLTGVQPDTLRIGGANGPTVQIASWSSCGNASCINYSTNTITLAASVTRTPGTAVYLYKRSDGSAVLNLGAANPDMGALPALSAVVLSNSPSSAAFGNVQSGQTGTPATVTVSNLGSANAQAITCSLTGTNASQFSLSGACPGTLASGGNFTQTVNCVPTGTGAFSANLSINDAPDGVSASTTLSCTGTSQAPNLVNSPTSIAFGSQPTGTTSTGQGVTITNNGTGLATISSCALTGTNANQFTLSGTCAGTLAINANFTQTIAFAPTTIGAKSASLTITYDSGATSVTTLSGTGIATAPSYNLTASSACGSSNLNVPKNCPAETLTNTGNASGTISSIGLSGATSASFSVVAGAPCNSLPATLAAAGTCTLTPTMTPLAAGALAATLTVTDTPNSLTATSSITGTGTNPNTFTKIQVTTCGPKSFPSGTGATCTITSTGSGNLLAVMIDTGNGFQPATITITDNQGSTYSAAVDGSSNPVSCIDSNTGAKGYAFYASNVAAGVTTLTLTPSATGTMAVVVYELHGPTMQDPGASGSLNSQAASTTPTGPSVTVNASQEALISNISVQGGVSGIFAGNAFTNDSLLFGNGWASLITSSTGAFQAKWNSTSGTSCGIAAGFSLSAPSVNTPGGLSVSGALTNGVITH